ncbi:MAG: glycosyltransferase family 39 protein [Terracidiphilus sp.]
MSHATRRVLYGLWLALLLGFAALHAMHLSADFPNHTPWYMDGAKYTDEGWYGNAAIRAHLFGRWYVQGGFNPAPAVPVWPFLEWIEFFFTGVSAAAARGLAVGFFFLNLALSYLLLSWRGRRWAALLGLTLLVTSPFLYCFSRLAILEPLLTALMLAALNVAVRLKKARRPAWNAAGIGLLFTLMLLTKTTAVFLLPSLAWAMLLPLRREKRKQEWRCLMAAGATSAVSFGIWMALVARAGMLPDFKYLFFINTYSKPRQIYWPIVSFWWSFHGGLWVDHILVPLAGVLALAALAAWRWAGARDEGSWSAWGRGLAMDPVFGASALAAMGYVLFMTYQDHPQPRYFAVMAFFCFFMVARGTETLLSGDGARGQMGWAALALAAGAVAVNSAWTLSYATHPEYTWVEAARSLTRYIDEHPNGNRLLVSSSGDEITLVTHLPAMCDVFGTPTLEIPDLGTRIEVYRPGWYATWNDMDQGMLADLHTHYSVEQVASFHAFDDPNRNVLVLFRLHPLPGGAERDEDAENLAVPLPGDKIEIPVE